MNALKAVKGRVYGAMEGNRFYNGLLRKVGNRFIDGPVQAATGALVGFPLAAGAATTETDSSGLGAMADYATGSIRGYTEVIPGLIETIKKGREVINAGIEINTAAQPARQNLEGILDAVGSEEMGMRERAREVIDNSRELIGDEIVGGTQEGTYSRLSDVLTAREAQLENYAAEQVDLLAEMLDTAVWNMSNNPIETGTVIAGGLALGVASGVAIQRAIKKRTGIPVTTLGEDLNYALNQVFVAKPTTLAMQASVGIALAKEGLYSRFTDIKEGVTEAYFNLLATYEAEWKDAAVELMREGTNRYIQSLEGQIRIFGRLFGNDSLSNIELGRLGVDRQSLGRMGEATGELQEAVVRIGELRDSEVTMGETYSRGIEAAGEVGDYVVDTARGVRPLSGASDALREQMPKIKEGLVDAGLFIADNPGKAALLAATFYAAGKAVPIVTTSATQPLFNRAGEEVRSMVDYVKNFYRSKQTLE